MDGGQGAAHGLQECRDLCVELLDACADGEDVGPAGGEPVQLEAVTGRQGCVDTLKLCQLLQRNSAQSSRPSTSRTTGAPTRSSGVVQGRRFSCSTRSPACIRASSTSPVG